VRENVLREDEILVGVELRAPATGARSSYHKVMDRESWTHAVVSAAVVLELEGDVCRGARIVLGGVAPTPWRVPAAEQVLVGNRVTAAVAARAAEVALEGARPLSRNGYKVPLTKGVVERTLVELLPA
jgi:xanthine dehydrogenase YagS FAD-binding subunit